MTRKEKQKWCQEIPSPKWRKDSLKSPGKAGWVTFFENEVSLNNSTGFLLHTMRTRKLGTKTGNDTTQGSHLDVPRQPQKSKEPTKMFRLCSWPVNSVPQNTGLFKLSLSRVRKLQLYWECRSLFRAEEGDGFRILNDSSGLDFGEKYPPENARLGVMKL